MSSGNWHFDKDLIGDGYTGRNSTGETVHVEKDLIGDGFTVRPGPVGGYGGYVSSAGGGTGLGALWLVGGFWWAIASWFFLTIQRGWRVPLPFIGVVWAALGVAFAIVAVILNKKGDRLNGGGGAAVFVLAAIAQAVALFLAMKSRGLGRGNPTGIRRSVFALDSPIPYGTALILPATVGVYLIARTAFRLIKS